MTELLYLSEKDIIKAGILDPEICINNAADCFALLASGDCLMGGPHESEHGIKLFFPKEERFPGFPTNNGNDHRFAAMPAYAGGRFHAGGMKWICANTDNLNIGVPRSNSFYLLSELDTGVVYCAIAGNLISTMRSGAGSAVGMKYLAPAAETMGLIGAGVMNKSVIVCAKTAMPKIKEIKVYDILPEKCKAYCKEMSELSGIHVYPVDTYEQAFHADVVHCAASNPISVPEGLLKPSSVLVVAATVNIAPEVLCASNIVFDQMHIHKVWRAAEGGSMPTFDALEQIEANKISPADIYDMGDIHTGTRKAPKNGKTTIFYWMGAPLMDVALAEEIYQLAREKGIGTTLEMWDEPYWA